MKQNHEQTVARTNLLRAHFNAGTLTIAQLKELARLTHTPLFLVRDNYVNHLASMPPKK